MASDLLEHVQAARGTLKAAQRACRTALQVVTDLEERLEAFESHGLEEAQRNDSTNRNGSQARREAGALEG